MTDFSQKKAGNYTIIKKIGDGGFATVYLAEHSILEKKAAVKFLLEEWVGEADVVSRFFDEARTMERLKDHPNIVKIIDIASVEKCKEEGLPPYFIMEYVEGKSLEEYINSDEGFSVEDVVEIMSCALQSLQHCHNLGVVHRDIKPSNIMITNTGEVKLTDFGIAKARVNTSKTGEGLTLGSTDYMSPEQALGKKDLDYRSDIYSLGVTLYQMVCDRLPFIGDSPNAVALKHIQEPLIEPVKRNDAIPKRLSDIIVKAMEKNKELRFQSCNEMLEAIQNLDGDEPEVNVDVDSVDLSELSSELPEDDYAGEFSTTPTHSTTRKLAAKPPESLIAFIRIFVFMIFTVGLFLGAFKLYNYIITSHISVVTVPKGANVTLNGEQVGTSPIQLAIPPMGYKISLTMEGYATRTLYFDLVARQNFVLKTPLIKIVNENKVSLPYDAVKAAVRSLPSSNPKTKLAAKKLAKARQKVEKAWADLFAKVANYSENDGINLDLIKFCEDNNSLERAKKYFESMVNSHKSATIYTLLGLVEKKLGDRKKALKTFMKAWEIDKNNKFLLNTLANYFIEGNNLKKAKQYLQMSLFLYPEQTDIRNKLISLK